jgi:hypothetical protein
VFTARYGRPSLGSSRQAPASQNGVPCCILIYIVWLFLWATWDQEWLLSKYFIFSTIGIIPPILHTHLHVHVAHTRTSGRSLGTLGEHSTDTFNSFLSLKAEADFEETIFCEIYIWHTPRAQCIHFLCTVGHNYVVFNKYSTAGHPWTDFKQSSHPGRPSSPFPHTR